MANIIISENNSYPFFQGGGEMGELIRSYNWDASPLGSPEFWPGALKISVGIMLQSPFPMHITWGDTFIQLYNDGYRPLLGQSKHPGALGQPIWDSFPEIWDTIGPMFHGVMKGNAVRFRDYKLFLDRNGYSEECYFDFAYSPIMDEEGVIGGVLTNEIETTERKLNELEKERLADELSVVNGEMAAANEELRIANEELEFAQQELQAAFYKLDESEIALRLAIEAANFGTWYINSETRAFITDARLKELFGYHAEDNITIEDAISQITPEYREYVSGKLEASIYKGGDYDVTYPVVGFHDKKLRWLRAIGNLKADKSGTFSAFTGVVMDVSDLKQDEIRKNDFIGMVSHELKTPLTSLTAIIQVANAKLKSSDDQFLGNAMEKANVQVKRMSNMINGFLNVSRLESGKIFLQKSTFQIDTLLKEAIQDILLTAVDRKIELSPCGGVQVHADREKIGSVLTNLLSNAVKYSPKNTPIKLKCQVRADELEISVEDEGFGISEADQARIFERYYRVDNANATMISGFGIGLYLSAEIIERHGGKIGVKSEPGKGSIFSFIIPLL